MPVVHFVPQDMMAEGLCHGKALCQPPFLALFWGPLLGSGAQSAAEGASLCQSGTQDGDPL